MAKPSKSVLKEWQKLRDDAERALGDLHQQMQDHWDEQSEKWQESEAGDEFQIVLDQVEVMRDMLDDLPNWAGGGG